MPVDFDEIEIGKKYTRPELATLWGYRGFDAIRRGIVTPKDTKKIVLFITHRNSPHLTQYDDVFDGKHLTVDGEKNHRADKRLIDAKEAGDEIHLFYREQAGESFIYHGELQPMHHELHSEKPSRFHFKIKDSYNLAKSTLDAEQATHGTSDDGGDEEGKILYRRHIAYERSIRNRAKAIEIHGTICKVCGFDFDVTYGPEYARQYIEIHHIRSVSVGVRKVNPSTDLIPLCSNCHSMAHRRVGEICSVEELKAKIEVSKKLRLSFNSDC